MAERKNGDLSADMHPGADRTYAGPTVPVDGAPGADRTHAGPTVPAEGDSDAGRVLSIPASPSTEAPADGCAAAESTPRPARRWYTYMVRCRDGSLYTGMAADSAARRAAEHNAGRGAKYTRSRRPVVLVWEREWPTEREARSAEAKIKHWKKEEKEALVRAFGKEP